MHVSQIIMESLENESRVSTLRSRLFGQLHSWFNKRQDSITQIYRRRLLEDLQGSVLEIGCGSGSNFQFYPTGVKVVAIEPNPKLFSMAKEELSNPAVKANITLLPMGIGDPGLEDKLPSGGFDNIVYSMMLCSIPDMGLSVEGSLPWLKPGGRVTLMEQVQHDNFFSKYAQYFANPIFHLIMDGCWLVRPTDKQAKALPSLRLDEESYFNLVSVLLRGWFGRFTKKDDPEYNPKGLPRCDVYEPTMSRASTGISSIIEKDLQEKGLIPKHEKPSADVTADLNPTVKSKNNDVNSFFDKDHEVFEGDKSDVKSSTSSITRSSRIDRDLSANVRSPKLSPERTPRSSTSESISSPKVEALPHRIFTEANKKSSSENSLNHQCSMHSPGEKCPFESSGKTTEELLAALHKASEGPHIFTKTEIDTHKEIIPVNQTKPKQILSDSAKSPPPSSGILETKSASLKHSSEDEQESIESKISKLRKEISNDLETYGADVMNFHALKEVVGEMASEGEPNTVCVDGNCDENCYYRYNIPL